jgi:hypothetical protein
MSTSYADSAQAREWDRRYDDYGRPKVAPADLFHDYDAANPEHSQRLDDRRRRQAEEDKASAKRVSAAVEQIGDFFGLNDNVSNSPLHGTDDVQGVNMNAMTELATVPPKETALAVYSAPNGLEPWLQKIRDEVLAFVPDTSTAKGRAAIASIAHNVAKSRVALDDAGKKLVAELKEVPKLIDAERKRMRETLEALQEQVRRPLNEWQAAEDARIDAHKAVIEHIENTDTAGMSAALIGAKIQDLDSLVINQELEEFEADAHRAKAGSLVTLRKALVDQEQYEADQAELAQRRADDEARAQREHDEQIRKEAAEKAQRDADEAAQRERDQAEQREKALKQQAEDAERKAEQAKRDKEEADRRAERERKEAVTRQEQAVEQARLDEKKRADDAAAEIVRQQDARAADTAHRAKINRSALEAFTANGLTESCAKQAITLIVQGKIPAIALTY